jgi:hypothetical protein
MLFLFRAVFWTAVVVILLPAAAPPAREPVAAARILERFKANAFLTLERVQAELNERHLRAS